MQATKADEPTTVQKDAVASPELAEMRAAIAKLAEGQAEMGKMFSKAANTSAATDQTRPRSVAVRIGKGQVEVEEYGAPAPRLSKREMIEDATVARLEELAIGGAIAKIIAVGGRPVNNDPSSKGGAAGGR